MVAIPSRVPRLPSDCSALRITAPPCTHQTHHLPPPTQKQHFTPNTENGVVGALWSLCYSPALHVLLYGGCDGLVGAAAWEFPTDTRYRRPHVPLVGLARWGRVGSRAWGA